MADEAVRATTPPAGTDEQTRLGSKAPRQASQPPSATERAQRAWTQSRSGYTDDEATQVGTSSVDSVRGSLSGRLKGDQTPRKETTLETGEVLGNTYRVEAFIARGGMGAVYRARHLILDSEHAIKVIVPELANDPQILAMMKSEATALKKVKHEAVVQYEGLFLDEHKRRYLVMEFVDGPSLAHLLRERALEIDEVRTLRDRLALGLAATHDRGVFHRDVSPDNVILPEGRIENAKLIDFGIAKNVEAETADDEEEEDFAGKFSYVSPEQAGMFGGRVDGRSDMYSLALVLASAALGHGRKIDMGTTPATVYERRQSVPDLSEVPAELRAELAVMLQPNPDDRPASLREIVPLERRGGETVTIIRERATPGLMIGSAAAVVALAAALGGLFFGFPSLFRPYFADDPAVVEANVRNAVGEVQCSMIDVAVSSDRFFRNTVKVSGIVPSAGDIRRIDADLGMLSRVAQLELALDVVEWPFCEAVRTVRAIAAPASPEATPRIESWRRDFVFRDGESLVFDVVAPRAGFLYVAYVTNGNDLVEMLPTPRRPQHLVEAGEVVRIGAHPAERKEGEAMYLIEPPFGKYLVLVTQSERPLMGVPKSTLTTPADYLDRLRIATQAAVAQGAAAPQMAYRFVTTVAR
jgi:hypothetical protein